MNPETASTFYIDLMRKSKRVKCGGSGKSIHKEKFLFQRVFATD